MLDDRGQADPGVVEGLSPELSRSYWDKRHAEADALASGGHISYDMSSNAMLYAVRTARLITALGDRSDPRAPLRILDAGCGKGNFTRSLAAFGHLVDGIDPSVHANNLCREQAGPGESFHVSTLSEWQAPYLYVAVVCIDVLYHLMDDAEWEASVRNLGQQVRLGGRLGLVDHDRETDRVWSNYQRTRGLPRYRALLEEMGFRMTGVVRNDFRDDPSGMLMAVRVA